MKIKKILFVFVLLIYGTGCARVPSFDGKKAFTLIEKQCDMGPRFPGAAGHKACLKWMIAYLENTGASVQTQPFPFKNYKTGETMMLTNVIASFGAQKKRCLFCAHWDTRPWADSDPNPENHNQPVPGANDGASGVAVLLEIASVLQKYPPPAGVDLVFFDGEDAGINGLTHSWCQGSQYFAENLLVPTDQTQAVLIDMIGDKDLRIPKEGHSVQFAHGLVQKLWKKAAVLGLHAFENRTGPYVIDDHIPLLRAGIPAIDIIDFDYEFWHTIEDTPDKCSAESLQTIGTLLLNVLYEE